MKVIEIPYNRNTVLADVKAVIEYPCTIKVIHEVPSRYSPNHGQMVERSHEWGSGVYGHESGSYLNQALYLDVEPWYYPATKVRIEVFTEDEYVARVVGKGVMSNPDWEKLSFEERCKTPSFVPATEERIRAYYKSIHPKGYSSILQVELY